MKIHVKLNAYAALQKLGVAENLLSDTLIQGWQVKLLNDGFYFDSGIKTKHFNLTLSEIQALSSDTMPQAEKEKLRLTLEEGIANLLLEKEAHEAQEAVKAELAKMLDDNPLVVIEHPPVLAEESVLSDLPPVKTKKTSKAKAKSGGEEWGVFDLEKVKTAPPVKLRDANMLYQPVKGTSPHSRYFLVGGNDELRVAARYEGTTLSVRIEGDGLKKHKMAIIECGVNYAEKQDYASVHLSVQDRVMANKTLGAVLLGLGVEFETPLPNVAKIEGKGA